MKLFAVDPLISIEEAERIHRLSLGVIAIIRSDSGFVAEIPEDLPEEQLRHCFRHYRIELIRRAQFKKCASRRKKMANGNGGNGGGTTTTNEKRKTIAPAITTHHAARPGHCGVCHDRIEPQLLARDPKATLCLFCLREKDQTMAGFCRFCGEPINPKRLAIVPGATACVPCLNLIEIGEVPFPNVEPSEASDIDD